GLEGADGWGVEVEASAEVPPASGLGSSAAAAVAGLWGADALFGHPLGYDRLLEMAAELEGHPDNAAACALGGWTVAARRGDRVLAVRLAVPRGEVAGVVVLPRVQLFTEQARQVLPSRVSLQEAVFELSGAALVTACLTMGRWELLRWAMEDRLHQPARLGLVPGAGQAMEAAMAEGAYGACLSGAGPSVLALCPPWHAPRVGAAMQQAFGQHGLESRVWVLDVAEEGVRVRARKEPVAQAEQVDQTS
ncbi:MAG TPA: homoserine kinase, partial [Limnochordales bacterium]